MGRVGPAADGREAEHDMVHSTTRCEPATQQGSGRSRAVARPLGGRDRCRPWSAPAALVMAATVGLLLTVAALAATSSAAVAAVRPDIPPPPSERSTTTTEPSSSSTSPPTTARRASTTGDDPVSQAQLADVNQRLDRATSTATIALVVSVAALLLAAIGVVLSRTGRRAPPAGR